ncbi:MAG: threonylcarbamoyl-AMP synthase [Oscillospiraceae bacterium]|nr:threonylcarbamoyl-AMP synthase [Oscillospiraceae bacterium]
MMTLLIDNDISKAAEIIKSGGLVGVPTETVYGLAGNGLDTKAVERIYEVKGRPAVKPLSLMVPDKSAMEKYCEDVPDAAYALADKFWPGPLTIVLKSKEIVPDIVRAGGCTVGLRCPDHLKTLELLKLAGLPLAAPSANPSDMPSPKTAGEVMEYFDGSIEAVIDGGECGIGLESTLLDMSRTPYRILRQGALSEGDIAGALTDNMCILGITGPTGCGKTTALKQLENFGALVLDCDRVYHELLTEDKELLSELEARFPGTVENGVLDRKALGSIVFSDPEELAALNRISHAHISVEIRRRLCNFAMSGGKLAALDAIELISSGLASCCDTVIGVLSDREKRAERIMKRDGIDKAAAMLRIEAQRDDIYFEENCDHVLYNNGTEEEFCDLVINLLTEVI